MESEGRSTRDGVGTLSVTVGLDETLRDTDDEGIMLVVHDASRIFNGFGVHDGDNDSEPQTVRGQHITWCKRLCVRIAYVVPAPLSKAA